MRKVYQLNKDGKIYSSRIKAHYSLCAEANQDPETFLPIREKINLLGKSLPVSNEVAKKHFREDGGIVFYPGGYTIYERPIL